MQILLECCNTVYSYIHCGFLLRSKYSYFVTIFRYFCRRLPLHITITLWSKYFCCNCYFCQYFCTLWKFSLKVKSCARLNLIRLYAETYVWKFVYQILMSLLSNFVKYNLISVPCWRVFFGYRHPHFDLIDGHRLCWWQVRWKRVNISFSTLKFLMKSNFSVGYFCTAAFFYFLTF